MSAICKAHGAPPGPWDGECDAAYWVDDASKLPCLILRHESWGSWCGYVGIPQSHPMHGLDHSDPIPNWAVDAAQRARGHRVSDIGIIPALIAAGSGGGIEGMSVGNLIAVHGGVTWAAAGFELDGRLDGYWTFGFDCGHAWDLSPTTPFRSPARRAYRTEAYARGECARMAQQLVELAKAATRDAAQHAPIRED